MPLQYWCFQAMHSFSAEYTSALKALSSKHFEFYPTDDYINEKKFVIRIAGTGYDYYYGLKSDFGFEEGESIFSDGNEDGLVKMSIAFVSGTEASGFTIKDIAGSSFAYKGDEGLYFDNDGKWPWQNV